VDAKETEVKQLIEQIKVKEAELELKAH